MRGHAESQDAKDVAMEVQRCCHAWAHGGCVAVTLREALHERQTAHEPWPRCEGVFSWRKNLSFGIIDISFLLDK